MATYPETGSLNWDDELKAYIDTKGGEAAAEEARQARDAAVVAKGQAEAAKSGAQDARDDAQDARDDAQDARDLAQTYRDQASEITGLTGEDDAVAFLISNPSDTQTALTAQTAYMRARTRRVVERAVKGITRRVALPDGFGWDPGVPVLTDGVTYWTPFDVESKANTGGETWYISTVGSLLAPGTEVGVLTTALEAGSQPTSIALTAATAAVDDGLNIAIVNGTDVVYLGLSATLSVSETTASVNAPANRLPTRFPAGSKVIAPRHSMANTLGGSYAAPGDTIILLDQMNYRAQGLQWTQITQSINIVGLRPGTRLVSSDQATSWTLSPGTTAVYEAARTNVRTVVDISDGGDGVEYQRVGSVAECEATPGSWYQAADGTGKVYVHTLTGAVPDNSKILALLTETGTGDIFSTGSTAMTVFFKNLRIFGANYGVRPRATGSGKLTFVAKDCDFLWGGYGNVNANASGLYNGLNVLGNVESYCQRVTIGNSGLDGFNYHALSGYIPKFVEIDCHAYGGGTPSFSVTAGVGPTQNGTTAHDAVPGIRIAGRYHDTYGSLVADVHAGTQTVNYGCDAWGSHCDPSTHYNAAFSAQQAGAEMWLIGCRGWGTTADIYAATGATMHLDHTTEYDTKAGNGTFDLVS